ncbi:MAG TPA: 30S ribosomal protein S5 [Fimbriimonadales bacterium]|jgi:small subunit ribosomal protein S5|nr:30S ribosomal protein S5 [Fimbriimonadales bacterium]
MAGKFQGSGKRESTDGLDVRVVQTNRVSKTHKGGKTPSWSCLVVAGNGQGKVGAAIGKARSVPDAIRKGEEAARKSMVEVPVVQRTIPHMIIGKTGSTSVLLRPASPGTGVVAGGAVRALLEAAGIHDVLAKTLGSRNAVNCAWATIDALSGLMKPEVRAGERGLDTKELTPWLKKTRKQETDDEAAGQTD